MSGERFKVAPVYGDGPGRSAYRGSQVAAEKLAHRLLDADASLVEIWERRGGGPWALLQVLEWESDEYGDWVTTTLPYSGVLLLAQLLE